MGLIRYLKSLFSRKDARKEQRPAQIQAEPVVEELDRVLKESPPYVAKARSVTVTVGLDFGTSTTKCVVNLEGENDLRDKFLAVSFPHEGSAEGTLCVPTAIGVDDHTLLFGFTAERLTEDKIIRSFKMAIPCMEDEWSSYQSPFMLKHRPGKFEICGHEVSALDLSVLYLAVILRQIKTQLTIHLGANADLQQVYLNMAAPLDQLKKYYEAVGHATKQDKNNILLGNAVRDTKLSEHYMQLGQWSLRLADYSKNPWMIEDALASLQRAKEQGILSFEDSPAYVLPESVAAISAYVNRPRTTQGRFISFDVGAGSTDVSVFWLQKQHGSPKPSYYSSGSLHLGMDNIDLSLSEVLAQESNSPLRQRRETLENIDGNLRQYEDRWRPILNEIEGHKSRVFSLGYDKERIRANWGDKNKADVTLLMLGGGCQSCMMDRIHNMSLWQNFVGAPSHEILNLDFTEKVILPEGTEAVLSEIPPLSQQAGLLVVAEGLAQKIIDIPDYEIVTEPIFVRPRVPKENYLTGQWW